MAIHGKIWFLKGRHHEYKVVESHLDQTPYTRYEVFLNDAKLFGDIERPSLETCESRRKFSSPTGAYVPKLYSRATSKYD